MQVDSSLDFRNPQVTTEARVKLDYLLSALMVFVVVGCADQTAAPTQAKSGLITLQNPSFELPGSEHEVPGWTTAQHGGEPSYEMTIDETSATEGAKSFRMTQIKPQFYGLLDQRVDVASDLVNRTFQLSAQAKSSNVGLNGWALLLYFYDATGYLLAEHHSTPLLGTTEWQRVSVSANVPANTTKVAIGVQLTDSGNGGIGWIDDVKLEVMDAKSLTGQ